ncbi:hypothetical protein HK405_014594, partial [Cladochytrium tenue]
PKFFKKIEWVPSLFELAKQVPMARVEVPNPVLEIDKSLGAKYTPPLVTPKQFGVAIEALMGEGGENGLPRVVKECTIFLRAVGLHTEGLFRRSPSVNQMRFVREEYNRNTPFVDLDSHGGVHLACVLLKTFFKELPHPIIGAEHYDTIAKIHTFDNEAGRVDFIRTTVLPLLPRPAVLLLRHVFALLSEVHANRADTRMDAHNLAIVWAPNLVSSSDAVRDFNACAVRGPAALSAASAAAATASAGGGGGLSAAGGASGGGSGGVGTLAVLLIERWADVFPEGEEGYADLSERDRALVAKLVG